MNKKLLMIVLPVVLVAGGAGAFLMLGKSEHEAPVEAKAEPPGLVTMETFLVNIHESGRDRFAKVNLQLAIAPASLAVSVSANPLMQAKMRDRILSLLTTKSSEELVSPIGKESFRREVKIALEPLLDDGQIDEVLFSDFVVQ